MHYKPEKEKAIEFIDKFEKKLFAIITTFQEFKLCLPKKYVMHFIMLVRSNNKIQSVDFVMRSTTDKPLNFEKKKCA